MIEPAGATETETEDIDFDVEECGAIECDCREYEALSLGGEALRLETFHVAARAEGMTQGWVSIPATMELAVEMFDRLARNESKLEFLAIADEDGVVLCEWIKGVDVVIAGDPK